MKSVRSDGGNAAESVAQTANAEDSRWTVSCDFDGTLAIDDVVNTLLDRFAEPAWLQVEAEWRSGLIGSRECLARQTLMLRVTPKGLADCVDQVAVDPEGAAFLADCRRMGHDVRIVSDGYDWVIDRVLRRIGVHRAPVVANRLIFCGGDRWRVEFPHAAPACGSGVCKCRASGGVERRVHLGDGRSDACAPDAADLVFAKGWLLDSRVRLGRPCIAFHTFADVRRDFAAALSAADVLAGRRESNLSRVVADV